MKRTLYADLLTWKSHPTHSPLLIRGARQVGKSHLVQTFGTNEFREILTINFEKEPRFESSFESFNPTDIINRLYLQTGKRVEPGKDLLFLDEIQECPNALAALRYFKEDLPELHVIATGSLLEFVLNDENLRMPVGRVDSLFLKPLSFSEFLSAIGSEQLNDYLETVTPDKGIEPFIHEELSQCLREYFFIGGMPAIIQEYLLTKNLQQVQLKQTSLMATLRQDFSKYATKANHRYMQKILEVSPGMIGQHFVYNRIDPEMRSREIKHALGYLLEAGLVHKVHRCSASGLPLNAFLNEKVFKIIFMDLGLSNAMSFLSPDLLLQKDLILINRGMQAEQFVGQELLANAPVYTPGQLYYWDREQPSSTAEVDYLIQVDEAIIPIEVKAGKTGSLRSLQLFLNEKSCPFGIRLSMKPLSFEQRVLSIPLYMIQHIPQLVRNLSSAIPESL